MATKKKAPAFDYKTIKSYEDACAHLKIDPLALPDCSGILPEFASAIINVYKLFIIFKTINNGWEPNWFNSSEWKYYPWLRVEASAALSSGFGFVLSYYGYAYTATNVGSRLCTDTEAKAIYIGETFREEYKEFFLIQK